MGKIKTYLYATRFPFATASVLPVVVAGILCWINDVFLFPHFLAAVFGALFLHLGANIMNDYYDTRGSDAVNPHPTPFSGGSRVILEGKMSEKEVFALGAVMYFLALIPAIYLTANGRPLVLLFGIIGAFLGFFYSASPLSFMSKGLGEIAIFLAFGPILTAGAYYAVSGEIEVESFLLGIPFGFFTTAILWINEFPDREPDRMVGKWHLVVRLEEGKAKAGYLLLIALGFTSIILLSLIGILPFISLISLFSLPLGLKAYSILKKYKDLSELIPAQANTILNQFVVSLLIVITLIIYKVV